MVVAVATAVAGATDADVVDVTHAAAGALLAANRSAARRRRSSSARRSAHARSAVAAPAVDITDAAAMVATHAAGEPRERCPRLLLRQRHQK